MKVAHIIVGLALGGAEKVVVDLCTKSTEYPDHRFYVISLTEDMVRKPDLDKAGIPVVSLSIQKNGVQVFNAVKKLRNFLQQENIDIIHTHMFHAYFIAILATFGSSVPIVFTGHSTNIGSKMREYFVWATRKLRKYDVVFSRDQQQFFHKKGQKTVVIPNGIDIDRFRQMQKSIPKDSPFTFLNVGNLEVEKNQLSLIHMACQMRDHLKSFQIKIVGEGSKMEELRRAIKENNLEGFIKILGKRKDVPQLMASSHCYLLPSVWEGMPITVLEAGSTGIPVISSPVGNVPQLLDSGRGYIANIERFVDTMEYVMDNYNESLERAQQLKEYIHSHFSMRQVYDEHINLYSQAL